MKTDMQLQKDVMDELKWEPSVNATHIGVEVEDGVVTLDGHVDSFCEKWQAEKVAQRVSGVRALAVNIEVKLLGSSVRSDSDIASAAEKMIHWTNFGHANAVKVMVEKGWVTVMGVVEWRFQRDNISKMLRHLLGVVGISNQVAISQKASSDTVKTDIERALRRRAKDDAHHIVVNVKGGEVTLSGKVQSWSERDLASHSAWNSHGVMNVVNHITVA